MKRNLSKTLAIVMALALALSLAAVTAFAAVTYTPVAGGETTMVKNLVVDADATIPAISFTYTIAAGTPVAATDENGMEIIAGPNPEAVVITPASFPSGNDANAGVPVDYADQSATGKKYDTANAKFDFSGVSFPAPGVYRYVVNEVDGGAPGVTYDTSARYLDVFVTANDSDELAVSAYVLRKVASSFVLATEGENAGKYVYDQDPDVKTDGYTNEVVSHDLEFSKAITGNQADKTKKFTFTLVLTDVNPGTYTVEIVGNDVVTDSATQTASTLVVPDGETGGTYTFSLTDGDSVKIYGLPEGYGYTLTEEAQDYTSTEKLDGYQDETSGTDVAADVKTGYTNTRNGIIPTGVIITVAPFVIGILVFGAIILYMVSKRRRAEY